MNELYQLIVITALFVLLYIAIDAATNCSTIALVFSVPSYLYTLSKVYLEN